MSVRIRVRARARVPRGRRHRAVLRAVHRRRVPRGGRRQGLQDRLARPPRRSSPRSPRPAPTDVDARSRPPARPSRRGRRCPAPSAPSTSSGSPGSSRSARRELAVLETLDNGKPIRETRDADLPLVAAHFFYYAGWADKLDHAGYGAEPAPARRRRPGHPVELPAADAGLEDRPGARHRQHGGPQARRDDPAVRAVLRGHLPPGRAAQGRRQHPHRATATRARRWSRTRTSTRSPSPARPRSARPSPAGRGHRQEGHPGAGRQGREHRLRRRPHRPGRRGHRQRHLLQPGPGLLRGLPPAGPGVGPGRAAGRAQAPAVAPCASATRWTRTPTSARSTPPSSWPGSPRSPRRARRRAPSAGPRRANCPSAGYWFAPTLFTASPRRTASRARRSSARCCRC